MSKRGKTTRKKAPCLVLTSVDTCESHDPIDKICSPHMRIIQARKILNGSYNPEKFKFRQTEIETIQSTIKKLIKKQKIKNSRIILLTGSPGTGKTLSANFILRNSPYRVIFMNANTIKSKTDVQQILVKQILKREDYKDLNTFKLISEFEKANIEPTILYIEQIELFFKSTFELLSEDFFQLFHKKNIPLVLLGISNTIDAVERHGQKMKVSVEDITNIVFHPYNNEQMIKIIQQKLAQINKATDIEIKFPGNLVNFTVNKLTQMKQSDMRYVFQFLKSLGKIILPENREDLKNIDVTISDINKALGEINTRRITIFETIPFGQQMVLIAIYNYLSKYEQLYITEEKLLKSLKQIYEILNLSKFKELKQELSELEDYGFVQMKGKKNTQKKDRIILKMPLEEIKFVYEDHPKYSKLLLY